MQQTLRDGGLTTSILLTGSTTVSPLYTHSCPMRWGDMDAQGHVNNAAYVDYLQEARVAFLLSSSPVLQQLLNSGVLVVNHQLEYLKPVAFSDRPLTTNLWVDAIGGSRFSIGYEVYDGADLAVRARTGVVPFDLASNRLRRLTTPERELLGRALAPAGPLRPLPKVALPADHHRYLLTVRWSDVDSYGHVNNVKYYDYIQEARISLVNDTVGWEPEAVWMVVRQDLEYLKPIDFRIEPYEVRTAVSVIGNRSFTLTAEISDPVSSTIYATARTVVVGVSPLTADQRSALDRWSVASR
jgi:acyl-CoA thioester hydrolase